MTSPVPITASPTLAAWVGLLRLHSGATRQVSAELVREHGLTLNDFEVLLHLSRADGGRLRRVDLVERVLLTPSGITRLLDGLEAAGLVERAECPSDRRAVYAVLTPAGRDRVEAAFVAHAAAVERLFEDRLDEDELAALGTLLERLNGTAEPCDA
jgi:DNA-binding MarR family transcriptional regulator